VGALFSDVCADMGADILEPGSEGLIVVVCGSLAPGLGREAGDAVAGRLSLEGQGRRGGDGGRHEAGVEHLVLDALCAGGGDGSGGAEGGEHLDEEVVEGGGVGEGGHLGGGER
jgi:hypothetical protein